MEKCEICKENLEASFSDKCECNQCHILFHTQCAKMRSLDKCVRCNTHLHIAISSNRQQLNKSKSVMSSRSSKSSRRSKVNLDMEHLRREEELFMQQQQEKQWLLEDKHKRQESFLRRKLELERKLSKEAESEDESEEEEFHDANEFHESIQKVMDWQKPAGEQHVSSETDNTIYKSVLSTENAGCVRSTNNRKKVVDLRKPNGTQQAAAASDKKSNKSVLPSRNMDGFSTINNRLRMMNLEKTAGGSPAAAESDETIYKSALSVDNVHGFSAINRFKDPKNFEGGTLKEHSFNFASGMPRGSWAARQVIKLELPSFDGNPEEWPRFLDTFKSTTAMCCIQDTENIRRLDVALKGSARTAVGGLLRRPDKVATIMERLRMLFGREDLIINSQIERLRSDNCSVTIESIESIIEYATKVENIASQMVEAEMKHHLCNPSLLQELVAKLPTILQLQWADYLSHFQSVNIETFSTWLFEKAMTASLVLTKPLKFDSAKKKSPTKALVNVHSEILKPKNCICEKDCKQLSDCEEFLSMNRKERWNAVNASNKCGQCLKNHGGRCFFSKNCGVNNCTLKHHPLLHKFEDSDVKDDEKVEVHHHSQGNGSTLFKVIPVIIHYNNISVATFAMLDDGSSLTLMEESLAKSLNITGTAEPLCLKWTGNTSKVEDNSIRASVEISSKVNPKRFNMNVRTVSSLNLPIQTLNGEDVKNQFLRSSEIEFPTYLNAQPKILIGLDNPTLIANSSARFSISGNLVIAKTKLGWTVFGAKANVSGRVLHICECQALNKTFKDFVTLDNLVVQTNVTNMLSDADLRANDLMEKSMIYSDGHYEMPLLWKHENINLPSSYKMALRRLQCLTNKFKRDPALKEEFNHQISHYLSKGYARVLSDEEIKRTSHLPNWYLPVFIVRNPNKPSKIRIVWDAAAKVGHTSLNDLLLKGPDLLTNLPGVLFRFRQWATAVTGDIREMFHQVKIRQEDQQFQRFLWTTEGSEEPRTLAMQVMTFGASCSPCCAQYVKNRNAEKFKKDYPRAVESIIRNHYVDDMLDSCPDDEEAVALAIQVRQIHSFAGFEIRNWKSNSENVLNVLEDSSSVDKVDLALSSDIPLEKILGMFWHTKKDCFTYSLKFNKSNSNILNGSKTPTKREMLRLVMSIYDPLGFLSHFLIYPKVLLQELWRQKLSWDGEIPDELVTKWKVWISKLPTLEELQIPRHYGLTSNSQNPDIHIFVDASEQAYAAVAYSRLVSNDEIKCSIIAAKSRVAPLKPLTIPRLELLAALLGSRLEQHIRKEHSIVFNKTYFWSDSQTVLSWIKSDMRNFKQYVACRISEILEHTQPEQWRWIPTDLNVADISTRVSAVDLNSSSIWFCGPTFLNEDESKWPQKTNISETREECRSCPVGSNLFYVGLLDVSRFSSWYRMLRTQAWVFRYYINLKSEIEMRNFSRLLGKLELQMAEKCIFKRTQSEFYEEEIKLLQNGKLTVSKKSTIYKKLPFLDENGLLRCQGRLDKMVVADVDLKNPIILPRKHPTTHLIIFYYHQRFHHHNHETIINELRQKFYIPNLRTEYKILKKMCQQCKNNNATPSDPQMSVLPEARLKPYTLPFTYTGIDFFGPMTVNMNRKTAKRWGVIFTCLNIRAVHIEIVHSLTTDSCIIALRNFMNRRCVPAEIFSDNGTNLKGASNELKQQISKIDKLKLAEQFVSPDTAWFFNPPACPHMGGAWERLVRSIKSTLSHIHLPRNPTDEVLLSTMIEIENVINSRPLTYLPIDDCDSEALTPNHFLKGSSDGVRKLGECGMESNLLVRSWKRSQCIANLFWKRWVVEYLPTLNRRVKWFEPGREIMVGDVVMIIDEKQSRNMWQKGLVIEVYKSRDGKVRKADVKTASNVYMRPSVKLAILDVRKVSTLDHEDPTNVPGAGVTSIANKTDDSQPDEHHP